MKIKPRILTVSQHSDHLAENQLTAVLPDWMINFGDPPQKAQSSGNIEKQPQATTGYQICLFLARSGEIENPRQTAPDNTITGLDRNSEHMNNPGFSGGQGDSSGSRHFCL